MNKFCTKIVSLLLCGCLAIPFTGCSNSANDGCIELTDAPSTTLNNVWYNPGGIFRCAIFDSLLTVDADMSVISSSLAEAYSVEDGGKTIVFTLRNDVLWHDGEEFNAEDVVFSVEAVLRSEKVNGVISASFMNIEGAEAFSSGDADDISGMEAEGDQLTFNIEGNPVDFVQAIAQFAILPEHILGDIQPNDIPEQTDYWNSPIGTGCYRIAEAVKDEYFLLTANEDYFGELASIKNMRIRLNETDCVAAMKEGRLDFYVTNDPGEISRMKGADNCSEHRLNILFPAYLIMNFSEDSAISEYLKDVRVREALLIAIDRTAVTEAVYPGSTVSDTMIPTWDSWYCTKSRTYEYNPEKAKAMLEEAGFDFSQTIRLRYSTKGQATSDLMSAIAVYWQSIGLKVDLQKFDGSGSEHMFSIRDFDVCYKRLSAFDRSSIYEEIAGNSIMQQNLLNMPVYDELIHQMAEASDENARKDIICQMQQLDQEYLLRLPLFSLANIAYVNDARFDMPDAYGNLWYRYDLCFSEWRLTQ